MSAVQSLEVVQNENGEIVLRRSDSAGSAAEPLVALRFSPEVRALLGPHLGEVALAMLGAGMQATQQLVLTAPAGADGTPPLLH